MAKTALVIGATGQDGAYLCHYLLGLGYNVIGSSRDALSCDTSRLSRLGILQDVKLISLAINDFRSVLKALSSVMPDEIYNLAGQTSVGLSFEQPVECVDSIFIGTLNILEVIKFLGGAIRYFNAGSSESFGDTGNMPANEDTPLKPKSPYAVAKAASYWQTATYREAYSLHACTGILANHESPLRPDRFVTQKIARGVKSIGDGKICKILLGNLDIWRDWGWAPDYVKAMHLMLQSNSATDYVIASGKTYSLMDFVDRIFDVAGLDSRKYIESSTQFSRPADLRFSALDPSKIKDELGWESSHSMTEIATKMYKELLF
jgi:GDPmannose 4,6-dehydratase